MKDKLKELLLTYAEFVNQELDKITDFYIYNEALFLKWNFFCGNRRAMKPNTSKTINS